MTEPGSTSPYALGSTDAEHERLIGQGARLAPLTERLFREAGIGAVSAFLTSALASATLPCWQPAWLGRLEKLWE